MTTAADNAHTRALEALARQQAEDDRAAAARAAAAYAHRKSLWDPKEHEWARERRRAAGLNADDYKIVEHFIDWAKHVDRFRVAGQIPEAVKAWERMSAAVEELDPDHRLWQFASREIRARGRSPYHENRPVKEGFSEFCADCAGGFYREHESAPAAPAAEQAPSAGERTDASPSGGIDPVDGVRLG